MIKKRDRRGSHRSEWGDETEPHQEPNFFQRLPVKAPAVGVVANVLWFNADKGFGFVEATDGSTAFLHARQLTAAGLTTVSQGASLSVVIQQGEKGPFVAEVVDLGPAPDSERTPSKTQTTGRSGVSTVVGEVAGVVRFYNEAKGFGFIAQEGEGDDIFIHASTLGRSGIATLAEGEAVWVQYVEGSKGLEAKSIRQR